MRSGGGRSENGNDATPVRKEYGAAAEMIWLCCRNDTALRWKQMENLMYILKVKKEKHRYVLEELVKEFLRPDEYEVVLDEPAEGKGLAEAAEGFEAGDDAGAEAGTETGAEAGKDVGAETGAEAGKDVGAETGAALGRSVKKKLTDDERKIENEERDSEKRRVFDELAKLTGYRPEWGTLTGVRPVKLFNELMDSGLSEEETADVFRKRYYVSEEKISLLAETYKNQRFVTSVKAGNTVGIYIGIPFCPTRCLYCSFASNQASGEAIERYLEALLIEVAAVGDRMKRFGIIPESIYIGGGTPTTLDARQLERLLKLVGDSFDMSHVAEYCVEAGRPDTIDKDKLEVLRRHNVGRISINPQSMNDRTLELIGRSHKVEDIYDAFRLVKSSGIPEINTDIIAGLPGEDYDMFMNTLRKVIELDPDNITVHTLAVKRASRLKEQNENYHYENAAGVGKMVGDARRLLAEKGYFPYYMYRQKHMAGNYENVSYAKPGTESIYNIRIMDEHQSIIALGAGGISKAYYPEENRLERVPNVTNFEIYIQRLDEMIERKDKALYEPFKGHDDDAGSLNG